MRLPPTNLALHSANASEPDFGVTCKHGPTECAGNVHELCAMKYASPSAFWEFVQCQNYQGIDKIGQPETALKCASTAQIDWVNSGVGDCAGLNGSGKATEGVLLLQNSVQVTEELGIEYVTETTLTHSPFDKCT